MTSANEDIVLRKVDEPEERKLPAGVYTIMFDGHLVFVRRFAGRFMPVSKQEQEELWQRFRL
jgi:hypothetical protein